MGKPRFREVKKTFLRAKIQTQVGFKQNLALNQPGYNPREQDICPNKGLACSRAL